MLQSIRRDRRAKGEDNVSRGEGLQNAVESIILNPVSSTHSHVAAKYPPIICSNLLPELTGPIAVCTLLVASPETEWVPSPWSCDLVYVPLAEPNRNSVCEM